MAEFSFNTNALGSPAATPLATPSSDPRRNNASHMRPQVAPSPGGYQQTNSAYSNVAPNQYGSVAAPGAQAPSGYQVTNDQPSYFPLQPQQQENGGVNALAGQMGAMSFGGDASATARPHNKKKDRHAYHQLESSAPVAAVAPSPIPGIASPYGVPPQQQITPAMSQFPAATPAFSPANQATPMQYAARTGDQLLGAPASSAQGRVDPDQVPSVPRSRDLPARHYLERIYPTMEHHLPPPAAVPFVAFDQGNASPKFARLTLNNIPASSDALASTGLPLGLVLQPLAPLQEGEQPIPVLDFGDAGPPRCRRCRTYINPFMTFRSGGNKFICNMCTHANDVPPEYFAPTDPSGVRVDRLQRPELMLGTVEFMVPREYWNKEPVPLHLVFLIDVSMEASSRGFLEGFCNGILDSLYGQDEDTPSDPEVEMKKKEKLPPGSKIAIVTFDREIHFYNLTAGLEQAQMMVMPDVEEPFVPLSQGLFADPDASRSVITNLLKQIPDMFSSIKSPEPVLLPALDSALSALSTTGGKIICSVSTLPTSGPGRLFMRDKNEGRDTDAEKKLYTTEHPGWKKTASKMVESGVGVDFFMAAPSGGYLDIATIGK